MSSTNIKKLLQVTEEAAPIVYIPFMVDNETFLLTQQDVRRIEDIRFLSYTRLEGNQPIYNNLTGNHTGLPSVLHDLISHCQPQTQETHNINLGHNIANISKQLNWSKSGKNTTLYPLSYSKSTSMCTLHESKYVHASQQCCPLCHIGCQANPQTKSQACNTSPPTKEHNPEQSNSKVHKKSNVEHCSNESLFKLSHCPPRDSGKCDACTTTEEHQSAEKHITFESPLATDNSQRITDNSHTNKKPCDDPEIQA